MTEQPEMMTHTTVATEGPQDAAALEAMLLQEIRPRLKSCIARTVPMVGAEDLEELL